VAGGIFISEKVYDEIKNQSSILTREMGYFELKNIRLPVRVYAISNDGIVVPNRDEVKGKTKEPGNRLAVLPFVNMSADPDNEYFSDGITEELLNALTRVEGLQVTSRTSVFAFKGKNEDVRDIAIKLNVDKVLEGSVRKSGNRVRITAQLINAVDGYHIWSENYDRNLTDIFEVQDEISGIIANKLRENLSMEKKQEPLVKPMTKNLTAYTHYLKGLHYWNKVTPADIRKAIECWEKAIVEEPGYALAYAMVACGYSYLGGMGQMSPAKAFEVVKRYSDMALSLDDTIADGHIARASSLLYYEWKWKEAFDELQVALKLNPGVIETYNLLSFYYIVVDQKNDAVKILEQAEKLDPLSPMVLFHLGKAYIFNEQYHDAIRVADKLLEMQPGMRTSIETKAWAIGMMGDWQQALPLFEEVHRLTNHPLKGLMGLGYAYTQLGQKEKAMDIIRRMELRQEQEPDTVIDADLGAVWWGMKDLDKTFYYLEKSMQKRMAPARYYLEYPAYKGIKDDPRYFELMNRYENTSGLLKEDER
jgi:TolB-like protein/Flp pilus assembly protein TadD